MKTKHTSLTTVSLGVSASEEIFTPLTAKNRLSQFIRLAIFGSLLVSGTASAQLLDHSANAGDNSGFGVTPLTTLVWPEWYRDTNKLALGLCKSQVPSPNPLSGLKPFCFPPLPDPAGFAGNVGPEVFYNMVGFKNKFGPGTGVPFGFRYVAGLEASYLPLGVPVHGTETVFARVRIALNFNDPALNGDYTVYHPFGVQQFTNVQATDNQNLFGANAAVFFTIDVPLGIIGNFDAALNGPVGPFLQWDVLQAGETLDVNGDGIKDFVGDPNYDHTFTGSTVLDANGKPQNYIRIVGPIGKDIDGQGNNFIETSFAAIMGQIWNAPIATATSIQAAYKTRDTTGTHNTINVWAKSDTKQKMILTGDGMPSMQMIESVAFPGIYHGYIESAFVPNTVKVTNMTSVPVISVTSGLPDAVEISLATFDTNTRVLTAVAHSTDAFALPSLAVKGIPGFPNGAPMTKPACPAGVGTGLNDFCFVTTLTADEPPTEIRVDSGELGSHADILANIQGKTENITPAPVAQSFTGVNAAPVNSIGAKQLTAAINTAMTANALITQQPTNGTITLIGGVWTFTPKANAAIGADSFKYVIQNPLTSAVSNEATVGLTITFISSAPKAINDQFAALVGTPIAVPVAANDTPASTNPLDQLNPNSIALVKAPSGTAVPTVNGSGTVTYTAKAGGSDTFTYNIKNSATPANTSNTATVTMTNFTGPESVSFSKVLYTTAKNSWTITGATTWFGVNLTQGTATCWNSNTTFNATTLIGSSAIDTTGKFSVVAVNVSPGVSGQSITCKTIYGGTRVAVPSIQ